MWLEKSAEHGVAKGRKPTPVILVIQFIYKPGLIRGKKQKTVALNDFRNQVVSFSSSSPYSRFNQVFKVANLDRIKKGNFSFEEAQFNVKRETYLRF